MALLGALMAPEATGVVLDSALLGGKPSSLNSESD
jgi:hypothetical protein